MAFNVQLRSEVISKLVCNDEDLWFSAGLDPRAPANPALPRTKEGKKDTRCDDDNIIL